MGTRHLIAVMKDDDYIVAQYGQWDGYPEGQGASVLQFLKEMNRSLFEEKLKNVSFISQTELQSRWVEAGADPDSEWVTLEVAERMEELYPENTRDIGAEILSLIYKEDRPIKVTNSISFAGDSLFCEWAYVVDLDKNVLEVYKGFNKDPLAESERFYQYSRDGEYYPIKLLKSFDLNNLPSHDDFINSLTPVRELA